MTASTDLTETEPDVRHRDDQPGPPAPLATTQVVPRQSKHDRSLLYMIGLLDTFLVRSVLRRIHAGEGDLDELEAFHLVVAAMEAAEDFFGAACSTMTRRQWPRLPAS